MKERKKKALQFRVSAKLSGTRVAFRNKQPQCHGVLKCELATDHKKYILQHHPQIGFQRAAARTVGQLNSSQQKFWEACCPDWCRTLEVSPFTLNYSMCIPYICIFFICLHPMGFPGGSEDKESSCNAGDWVQSLVGMIPWKKKWQCTKVFLPAKSHGQRSLSSYSPCSARGHDWATNTLTHPMCIPYTYLFCGSSKGYWLHIFLKIKYLKFCEYIKMNMNTKWIYV